MNVISRSVPAAATLAAVRRDSARRGGSSVARLCATAAETERLLAAVYQPTADMSCSDEIIYLERHDAVMTALSAEVGAAVDALAAIPINTPDDAASIAKLALQLCEIDGSGLFAPYETGRLLYGLAEFVASEAEATRR